MNFDFCVAGILTASPSSEEEEEEDERESWCFEVKVEPVVGMRLHTLLAQPNYRCRRQQCCKRVL